MAEPSETQDSSSSLEPSSTGLDPNLAGLLCYLLGFVTGLIFLVLERQSSFVRFHAMQSTLVFVGIFVLQIVLGWIPVIGGVFATLLSGAAVVIWIVCMVKAFQGERFRLPVVGDMADQRAQLP